MTILAAPTMSGTARRTAIPVLKSRIGIDDWFYLLTYFLVGTPILHRSMRPVVVMPDVEIALDLSTNTIIDNDAINTVCEPELIPTVLDLSTNNDTHVVRDANSILSTKFEQTNAIGNYFNQLSIHLFT
jgi:hypothetical protein